MKNLSLQSAILVAVALICASSISIALITDNDFDPSLHQRRGMMGRMSSPAMRGNFERGRHRDAEEHGPRNLKRGDMRDDRHSRRDYLRQSFGRGKGPQAPDRPGKPAIEGNAGGQ